MRGFAIKTISSTMTFFYKYLMPVVVLAFAMTVREELHSRIILGTVFVISCIFAFFIKRIRTDEQYLYISNFKHEIKVPFHEVMGVTDFWWLNPHAVMIKFRKRTPFGAMVYFAPRLRGTPILGIHPIVIELKEAAEQSKNQKL